ncbi:MULTISPECIES: metal-dependent hydrolase family protein [unclassified Microbacterium]|uniref:metal-dependent hydrolase family protein n=1 Tax=unclassified Microbacterium TaxID=2609290 RepID=UPI00049328E7|nr:MULTISPECIES: amidohydrolase family protein [unclassified Microbacterium]
MSWHRRGGDLLVRAGAVADVATGEILRDHGIRIEQGTITEVAPWSTGSNASDHLDLRGHLVTPGLIDMHTHLPGAAAQGTYADFLSGSAARDALLGAANALTTLRAGFTTVRDVGCFRAFVDCDLRDAIFAGHVPGPRMLAAGAFVTSSSGGGEITDLATDIPLPPQYRLGVADSVDEVRRAVRMIAHRRVDLIKVIATGAVMTSGTIPGAPEFTEAELAACVDEARGYGLAVAAHAHGDEGALRSIRAGVRTIEHGTMISDTAIAAMVEHETYYVPTTYVATWILDHGEELGFPAEMLAKTRSVAGAARDALGDAIDAGVKIAYGTDAVVYPHGLNARQLAEFVDAGMTPMDALRSATVVAANCLARNDLGTVAPGAVGDLIAVPGVDLNDMRAFEDVRLVIQAGHVIP